MTPETAQVTKLPDAAGMGSERQWISDACVKRIRRVAHYRGSECAGQCGGRDIQSTFGWYNTHFVDQISKLAPELNTQTIADIGTGYGWLAIAFALKTSSRIIAVEHDDRKLAAAREIAQIFGVAERIEWCAASLGKLPFRRQEIDITFCIEVVEHIDDDIQLMQDLARITRKFLVITTPNKLFPIINHDTALPCCHWLPPGRLRDWYATAFGRKERQENNRFWSPGKLISALSDFERVSTFLHFRDFQEYLEAEDQLYHAPQQRGGLTTTLKKAYYQTVACAGSRSIYALPNLASTFRRRPQTVLIG